jgi:alpha-L-arabinofuranosidase
MQHTKTILKASLLTTGALFSASCAQAQVPTEPATAPAQNWSINVNAAQPGAAINPNFYGLMTEEINHAYDGGLYAELIRNRSFRDDDNKLVFWSPVQSGGTTANISLEKTGGVNDALYASLKLDATTNGARVGVANDGYWGIPVKPKTTFTGSFYAKSTTKTPLTVSIETNDDKTVLAQTTVKGIGTDWKKYSFTLKTGDVAQSLNNRLVVSTTKTGTIWLSMVSLFPPTFNNRVNGNRIDLTQKLIDMKPAFLRFPGGNYVDPGHYEWKKSIGPLDERPIGRAEWGYRSSLGLGLTEFLFWCDEVKMEPLLAVTDGRGWLAGDADVTSLVQDALDEIEYVSGDAKTTKWGAKRAADGHPAPMKLRYVEIGNEDFFDKLDVYNARFAKFYDAIRAKYPDLKIIATRDDISSRRPDLIDDHLYPSVRDMLHASHNYDNYDRSKPKIFVGEWATKVGEPTPPLIAALSDAAYLTGLERNADVVQMACYAPLFVNVNRGARQWGTNLIGYDALTSFGSPSYYMQSLFSHNKGDTVLPIKLSMPAAPVTAPIPHGSIGLGTWDTQAEYKDVSVTANGATALKGDFSGAKSGWNEERGDWKTQDGSLVQTSNATYSFASIGDPKWTDYTYHLKARKISGAEGFLIFFHVKGADDAIFWNIGGWKNTRSALQVAGGTGNTEFGNTNTTVETGRWYDIYIDVKGTHIRGSIDGKVITEAEEPQSATPETIYASSSRDTATGDIILKVINMAENAQTVQLNINGAPKIAANAAGWLLTGQPGDQNSVAEPQKIAPQAITINNTGASFSHEFAASSVSVIRLKTR